MFFFFKYLPVTDFGSQISSPTNNQSFNFYKILFYVYKKKLFSLISFSKLFLLDYLNHRITSMENYDI